MYSIAIAVLLALLVGAGAIGYSKGSASRNPEIASLTAAIETSNRLAADAERRAKETSERVVIEYRDRVKVIREVTPAEIQLVEVIKHDATCMAPPAFRLLHDSAASGSPTVESPPGVDAAPVPLEEAAAVVAENYRIARENAARLEALQELVKSQ